MFWHSPDGLCSYEICVTMYELELMELPLYKFQCYLLLLFVLKYCQYWGKMYYLCLHIILILYFYRTYLVFRVHNCEGAEWVVCI